MASAKGKFLLPGAVAQFGSLDLKKRLFFWQNTPNLGVLGCLTKGLPELLLILPFSSLPNAIYKDFILTE
jgi:hypothetical protein